MFCITNPRQLKYISITGQIWEAQHSGASANCVLVLHACSNALVDDGLGLAGINLQLH